MCSQDIEWIAANVVQQPNSYVEVTKLWNDFRASLPPAQRKKASAGCFKEKAKDFMLTGGGMHFDSKSIGGTTVNNVITGYERVL